MEPTLFDDLLNKKKWGYINKDPSRSVKHADMYRTQVWNHLNHLPDSRVDLIMRKDGLKMDFMGCTRILEKMYEDFQNEDIKI
jgi:hypothetical protein